MYGYSPEHLTSADKLAYNSLEEKLLRFEVFRENLKHIDQRNKEKSSEDFSYRDAVDLPKSIDLGPKWGERGYLRMKRNTGKPEGLFRINRMASYPTKQK
ncbi:hypothetical protein SADUNF_Sadunf04G0148800 [Salix dunnii]|uniref:Cathepsin propeptide inhibitor domain-containing protein n=1 Tax=Salix dunnii TaxID=1413687 RepID=A0A835KBX2_9ROSI|nr:hypothetical protein SADUNF_Sadunf04G0148800 [Salix dunnii]